MGPIQIFLLGFEDFQAAGSLADELGALSAAGTIRIIDARFLLRESAARSRSRPGQRPAGQRA